MRNRILLYFLSIIFMAALIGCQKRLRVANPSMVKHGQGDYDKFAHIIVDVCDPEQVAKTRSESNFGKHTEFLCSVGMKKMEKDLEKIRDDRLKKLIKKYSNGFKSGGN